LKKKKLNFPDLQAYKISDPRQFTLVPGLINSKYTSPLGSHFALNNLVRQTPYSSESPEKAYTSNKRLSHLPEVEYAFSKELEESRQNRRNNKSCERLPAQSQYQSMNLAKPAYLAVSDKFYSVKSNNVTNLNADSNASFKPISLNNSAAPRSSRPSQDNITGFPTEKSMEIYQPKQNRQLTDMVITTPGINKRDNLISSNSRIQTEKTIFSPHNPILHPLAGNIQNPYILKEIKRLVDFKQSIPTNMNNNSVY